jgi:hypothetical protein
MVKDSGTTVRADRLRPLNTPRPLRVETDERGRPTAVGLSGQGSGARSRPPLPRPRTRIPVEEILDRWRIDDEWWRKEVSRMYFHVALEGGQLLTLFQDLTTARWYGQITATPLPGAGAQPVAAAPFGAPATGPAAVVGAGLESIRRAG